MAVPKPQEVAAVIVNGRSITNWESVSVQLRWAEAYDIFEFTTAESLPPAASWLNVMPTIGDRVQIFLAGKLVITGLVMMRQSAEDARRHTVQIIGKSDSSQLSKSTIKNETNNYDGMNMTQIAQSVAAEVGISVVEFGSVDHSPFPKMSSAKGQPSWDFLEHLAREKRTILSSNEFGQLVLIGDHSGPFQGDALTLPGNIERINVIWSNEAVYADYQAFSQDSGSDAGWGESSSQPEANTGGVDPHASNYVVPNEHATSQADVTKRAQFEQQLHDHTDLVVFATVQGWLRAGGDVWRPGLNYTVDAPNHLLNNFALKAKSVTFTQDDENGTQTQLELVKPEFLLGRAVS